MKGPPEKSYCTTPNSKKGTSEQDQVAPGLVHESLEISRMRLHGLSWQLSLSGGRIFSCLNRISPAAISVHCFLLFHCLTLRSCPCLIYTRPPLDDESSPLAFKQICFPLLLLCVIGSPVVIISKILHKTLSNP